MELKKKYFIEKNLRSFIFFSKGSKNKRTGK